MENNKKDENQGEILKNGQENTQPDDHKDEQISDHITQEDKMAEDKKEKLDKIAEDLKKDECENPIKLSEYLEHCDYQNKLED